MQKNARFGSTINVVAPNVIQADYQTVSVKNNLFGV